MNTYTYPNGSLTTSYRQLQCRHDFHWLRCGRGLSIQKRKHHLPMPTSDCFKVPSRVACASYNHCQSPSLALSCSWWSIKLWQQELLLSSLAVSLQVPPKLWNSLPPPLRDSTLKHTKTAKNSLALFNSPTRLVSRDCLGQRVINLHKFA